MRVVELQSIIKKLCSLAVVLVFLLLAFAGTTHSGAQTAEIRIQARVLPRLSFRILDQPSVLRIKKRELKKGKPGAKSRIKGRTVIAVESNNPAGYILRVQARDSRFLSSIEVTLKKSGQVFRLRPGGQIQIHIPNRGKDHDVTKLDFGITLSPEASEGAHPWPIAVSAHLL